MNKKYCLTFIAISLFGSLAFSQNFQWVHSNPVAYTLNPSMSMYTVCTSPSGIVYGGRLDSMVFYFGDMFGIEKIDCYNSDGLLQWSYRLGQKAIIQRMAADANGNLFAAGIFIDTLFLGSNDTLINTGPALTTNAFLISLDSTGSLRWKRNLSPAHPNADRIAAIRFDNNGSCWYGYAEFNNSNIIRIDSAGQDVLTRNIQGTRTLGGFDFDPHGNMFVSGGTKGGFTIGVGGISMTVNDSYMMYIMRIDVNGQGSWIRLGHDVTFQEPIVVCDPWGGAYMSGGLMDSVIWGNVILDRPQWVYDFFLTRTDSIGNFSWGVEVPHTSTIIGDFQRGENMFMDADTLGNVYVTGITRGIVDWGHGVTTGMGAPTNNSISFLSFDANGIPRWSLEGNSNHYDGAYAISMNQNGECYFAASVRDTAIFDTITVNEGGNLAFVLGKISPSIPTSIKSTTTDCHIHAYPNPATEKITIVLDSPKSFFELHDVTGKLLKRGDVHFSSYELDLSSFKNGFYFLTIHDKNSQEHIKIVKE